MDTLDTKIDLPLCQKCRYRFHFGKCSGSDAATWAKRGADSKKKWTCHVCDPNKNLSKSKSGVFTPADLADISGATAASAGVSAAQPLPNPLPQFNSIDEKCDYILAQVTMIVAQNAVMLRELHEARETAAEAKKIAEIAVIKADRLEDQVRAKEREISELKYKNRSLEDYSRVDNLIIHGVPHPKTEKDAFDMAIAVSKAVGLEIKHHNLSACHALGRPQNGVGRIVCRFTQRWLRNQLHSTINDKKITTAELDPELGITGEPIKIYATDHHSPQTSRIYSEARRLLSARFGGAYQQVYMRSRKIYARRFDGDAAIELLSLEHVMSLADRSGQFVDGPVTQQSNGL